MKTNNASCRNFCFLLFLASIVFVNNEPAYAQGKRANNWYFGIYAGLSFNTGSPPEVLYDGQTNFAAVGASSISDEDGNLLFYSNGAQIWNKEHNNLQNSNNIGWGSTQGAIFVPDPGNDNLYYYFNFGMDSPNVFDFRYSIIDLRLDNGLGGVLPGKKNIHLLEDPSYHLSAVHHANGEDVWVVAHTLGNNTYYSYKITVSGIELPIVSNVGSVFQNLHGYLKISPNGKKIAAAQSGDYNNNFCEILDFNTGTGIISETNLIRTPRPSAAVEFSPDNSKLYTNGHGINSFFQYDLNAGSPDEILASETLLIYEYTPEGALQLGPDGKIYCATSSYHIGVIHEPNKAGLECDYERYSIYVGDGRFVGEGLPSFIQSYLNDPEYATTQHCAGQPTHFAIANTNGIDSVYWKFKDFGNMPNDTSTQLNPAYTFSGPGTYYPELTVYSGLLHKTVKDTVVIYPLPTPQLGSDTLFCPGAAIALTLNAGPGDTYNWNGNFTPGSQTLAVTDTGTYFVRVRQHGCSGYDTIQVSSYPPATADITNAQFNNSNCNQADGSITGMAFGAVIPFGVVWHNAEGIEVGNAPDLLNVPAGSYTATVNFGSSCSQEFGPYS
ncbi:MAG: PKD domain-containing protein, partial [Mariniphaga sp.]|nr:PKD domain-containing protein [Mariniphaga sp.]